MYPITLTPNRSCALPYENWLDIKKKLVDNFARTAKGEKVLYVNGNKERQDFFHFL